MNWQPFQGAPFRAWSVYHVRCLATCYMARNRAEIFLDFAPPTYHYLASESALIVVAVIAAVSEDDVVNEAYVHGFRRFLHPLRQAVVFPAGLGTARRMVVAERNGRGVGEDGLAENEPHVDHSSRDAAATDTDTADDAQVVVHQQHVAFFNGIVAELVEEVAVNVFRRLCAGAFLHVLFLPPFAQFAGCKNRHRLRFADAFVAAELFERHLAHVAQTVAMVNEQALHEAHGIFRCRPRPDEDGQQFGIA